MGSRLVGVDVARFVALAGMMAIHVLPAYDEQGVTFSQQLAGGRASALFAVLAGVSLSLAQHHEHAVRGLVVRSVLIGTLGLWLGGLDTSILVILTYYALLFLAGAPFLALSSRALWATAGVWLVLAPVISHWVRPQLPPRSGDSPSFDSLDRPLRLVGELMVTGSYPVFVWLPYLLVGLAVGRLSLRSGKTHLWLGAGGAAAAWGSVVLSEALLARDGVREQLAQRAGGTPESLEVVLSGSLQGTTPTNTWWWLAVDSAHSGTTLDLTQTIGSALVVLAVALALGEQWPRLCSVVFGAGAMTLTLYSAHVVVRQVGRWDGDTVGVYVGQLAVAMLIGAVFGMLRLRGPLEWVVSRASRLARR